MANLIYWMIAGGAFGFYRAWKKTALSAERARENLDEVPDLDRQRKAEAIGYNSGLRFVALAFGTVIYALCGAAIWGAATLLLWLLGD